MDRQLASDISEKLVLLSRQDEQSQYADRIVEIAAEVELLSKDLQWCWGGPLNGQEGRRSIFAALIDAGNFDAILETGSFRGLTTAWLAGRFPGPIYTCESSRLYYLQARRNLERFPNVRVSLEDSRRFLEGKLGEMEGEKRLLVYLDAHWNEDLPLAEELKLLFSSGHKPIVVIDDFRVPEQPGYQYDDYGPGKALSLELLAFLDDPAFRFYFPSLPAEQETGARRGVCIVTNSLSDVLDACPLVAGGTWSRWRIRELEHQIASMNPPSGSEAAKEEDRQIKDVVEKCEEIKHLISDWSERFDTMAVSAAEYREYGKALVEERARNLDLKRRLHVLEADASIKEDARVELRTASDKLRMARAQLEELRTLMASVTNSRALQAVSTVAPKARLSVMVAAQRLDALVGSLG